MTARTDLTDLTAAAAAVIRESDASVSYEPCAACLRSGVALITGESYHRLDAALEALRATLGRITGDTPQAGA